MTNQHLMIPMARRQAHLHRSAQQGYILWVVLIALLFISGLTAVMLSQNHNDSAIVMQAERQSTLSHSARLGADKLLADSLVSRANQLPQWLSLVMMQSDDTVSVPLSGCLMDNQRFSLNDLQRLSASTQSISCTDGKFIFGDVRRLPTRHYLLSADVLANQTTPTAPVADGGMTNQAANTQGAVYAHLRLYVLAAANELPVCHQPAMQPAALLDCYAKAGVSARVTAAEMLLVLTTTMAAPQQTTALQLASVKPLRVYAVRQVQL